MKKLLLAVFLLTFININSQNTSDKKIAISTIEDISSFKNRIGPMVTNTSTKIDYSKDLGKIEHQIKLDFVGEKDESTITMTFYLDDIINSSMKYDFYELQDNEYFVKIRLQTKSKSVEIKNESVDSNSPFPTSDTEFTNKIEFYASSRTLSKYLMEKYLESVKSLVGATKYEREEFIKKELERN